MKVVLDTNVLVSGIFWGGNPLKVIELWTRGSIEVIASRRVLDEYLETIQKISDRARRPDLFSLWSLMLPKAIQLVDPVKTFSLCRDPDDDKFIDCAIAGGARFLVSGDRDLLALRRVMKVQVVSPKTFLDRMSSKT